MLDGVLAPASRDEVASVGIYTVYHDAVPIAPVTGYQIQIVSDAIHPSPSHMSSNPPIVHRPGTTTHVASGGGDVGE